MTETQGRPGAGRGGPRGDDRVSRRGSRRAPVGLVLANVALAGSVLALWSPDADGQSRSTRARGSYTLVGGDINGATENAVYILDAVNAELIAVRVVNRRNVEVMGYRDLNEDAETGRVAR